MHVQARYPSHDVAGRLAEGNIPSGYVSDKCSLHPPSIVVIMEYPNARNSRFARSNFVTALAITDSDLSSMEAVPEEHMLHNKSFHYSI